MLEQIQKFKERLLSSSKMMVAIKIAIAFLFALYIFVFCSFGSRPRLYLFSYPVLSLLAAVVCFYLFINFKELKKSFSLYLLIPLVFVIFVFISTLFGTKIFSYFKTTFLLTITYILSYIIYSSFRNIKIILYLITLPIVVFGLYYCIHYRSDLIHYSGQRLGSFFGNENDVGLNLFFGFALSTILVVPLKQYWMIPASLLLLFSSITTGSKKVIILTFLFILFLICVLFRKKKIPLVIGIAVIVVVLILFLTLPIFSSIRKRLLSGIPLFGNLEADASTVNRLLFFKSSFYLGTKSFIFGYGGSSFALYSGLNVYSHNNLGEILCDFGALGVMSFYVLYPILGLFVNKKDSIRLLIVFLFLGSFVFCSFTAIFFDSKIYYILFALAAYLVFDSKDNFLKAKKCTNTYSVIAV